MKIAKFQFSDGKIGKFEVPDDYTPERAQTEIEAQVYGSKQQQAPQETSQRIAGLGGRALLEGVASIPGGIYNTVSTLGNIFKPANAPVTPLTPPESINTQQYGTKLANMMGLPQETEGERIPMEVARTMSGFAVPLAGLAGKGERLGALGKMIGTSNPVSTVLSAGISKGASEIAKERGADPLTQAAIGAGAGMGSGSLMSMAAPVGRTAGRIGANVAGQLEGLAGRTLNRQAGSEAQTVQQLLEAGVVPGVKPFNKLIYDEAGNLLGEAPGSYKPTSSAIAGNAGISGLARFVENTPQAPVALSTRAFENSKALKDYASKTVPTEEDLFNTSAFSRRITNEITAPMVERNNPVNVSSVDEAFDKALNANQNNPAVTDGLAALKARFDAGKLQYGETFHPVYNFKKYIDQTLRSKNYTDPEVASVKKAAGALKDVKRELAKSLTEAEPEFSSVIQQQAIGIKHADQGKEARKLLAGIENASPLTSNVSGLQESFLSLSAPGLVKKLKDEKLMSKLSPYQQDILQNASKALSANTRKSMGMALGSNTAQNLKLDEMIAEDVARAFTGSDVSGSGGGLISGILRPATKGLSNVTGRTSQIADILAKAELDPAYAAMLMKKYKLSGPLDLKSAAGRNAIYGAIVQNNTNK